MNIRAVLNSKWSIAKQKASQQSVREIHSPLEGQMAGEHIVWRVAKPIG